MFSRSRPVAASGLVMWHSQVKSDSIPHVGTFPEMPGRRKRGGTSAGSSIPRYRWGAVVTDDPSSPLFRQDTIPTADVACGEASR